MCIVLNKKEGASCITTHLPGIIKFNTNDNATILLQIA